MTDELNRIRIAVGDRELELEGSAEFISQYDEVTAVLLHAIKEPGATRADAPRRQPKPSGGGGDEVGGEFGEELGRLPKSASQTDQMLLAGLFAQRSSEDNAFVTKEASGLLLEQSIKIGNPSQCMTNNMGAKRVFKVAGSKYRVSKSGEEYLSTMLGAE